MTMEPTCKEKFKHPSRDKFSKGRDEELLGQKWEISSGYQNILWSTKIPRRGKGLNLTLHQSLIFPDVKNFILKKILEFENIFQIIKSASTNKK